MVNKKWTQERIEHVRKTTSRNRVICQYDRDNNLIKEYISGAEAARQIGGDADSLNACANGRLKTYKGFQWRFKTPASSEQHSMS